MLRLVVVNKEREGKKVKLVDGLTVGSGKGCHVRAKHETMMDRHARFIEEEPGRFYLELIDQDGHIHVNGKDILRTELRHNDRIKIGPLRFRVEDTAGTKGGHSKLDDLLDKLENEEHDEVYDFAREDLFYLTNKDPYLRKRIAFSIPSRDRFIDSAQSFLSRLVRQSGIDDMKLEAFITCTKELILNAHRHGNQYDESKIITIRYRDLDDAIELRITDQGEGFDHQKILDQVKELSAAEAARQRYQSGGFGGLGFQMISRLADKLKYNEAGNEVTLTINKQFE